MKRWASGSSQLGDQPHPRVQRGHLAEALDPAGGQLDLALGDAGPFGDRRDLLIADLEQDLASGGDGTRQRGAHRRVEVDVGRAGRDRRGFEGFGREVETGVDAAAG